MGRIADALRAAAVLSGVPAVALGQGGDIEAKLGATSGAVFAVTDSNSNAILVLEARDQALGGPNVKAGHDDNAITSGVYGGTIGGGGKIGNTNAVTDDYGTVGGGLKNRAGDNAGTTADTPYATVGGGYWNTASGGWSTVGGGWGNSATYGACTVAGGTSNAAGPGWGATVGGGQTNTASGWDSTVGGGYLNVASGYGSIVPGGHENTAAGNYAFASGRRAQANFDGCFVWGDNSTDAYVSCGAVNRWRARASGGVWFYTNSALSTGVTVAAGGSSWAAVSDRAVKENFAPVDKRLVLEKVAAMPVEEWNLKTQDPSIRHIGPVAQDFHGAFGYGEEERYINMMDATGVTMAALQGLYEVVRDQEEALRAQKTEIERRDRRIERLEKDVKDLARLVRGASSSE